MPQNLVIKYPLDLSGNNPTNLVKDEPHTIEPTATNRGFALNYGPFYTKSVVVKHVESGNILRPRLDYLCLHLDEIATRESGYEVCIAILITNQTYNGEFEVTYQVVGGEYSSYVSVIQQLVEALQLDDRPVKWGDVIGKQDEYPPAPHLHTPDDLYGFEFLVDALMRIHQAILHGDSVDHAQMKKNIVNARTYAAQLVDGLRNVFEMHAGDLSNPHNVTKAQAGMGNVDNFATATPEEAVNPSVADKFMTPSLTHHAIAGSIPITLINGEIQRLWDAINAINAILALGKGTTTIWNTLTAWATLRQTTVVASRNTTIVIPAGPDRTSSWNTTFATNWSSNRLTNRMTSIGSTWNTSFTQNTTRTTNVSIVTVWDANTSRNTGYSKLTQTSENVVQNTTVSSSKVTTYQTSWTTNMGVVTRTSTWVTSFYSVSYVGRNTSTTNYQQVWQEQSKNTLTSWYSYTPIVGYGFNSSNGVWGNNTIGVTRTLRSRTTSTTVGPASRATQTTFATEWMSGGYRQMLMTWKTTSTQIGGNVGAYVNTTFITNFYSSFPKTRSTSTTISSPNLVPMSRQTSKTTTTTFNRVTSFSQSRDTTTAWTIATSWATQYSKTTAWDRVTDVITTIVQQTSNAAMVQTNFNTAVAMSKNTSVVTSVTVAGDVERTSTRSTSWDSSWGTQANTSQMTQFIRNTQTSFT